MSPFPGVKLRPSVTTMKNMAAILLAALAVAACSNTREVATPVDSVGQLYEVVALSNTVLSTRAYVNGTHRSGTLEEFPVEGCTTEGCQVGHFWVSPHIHAADLGLDSFEDDRRIGGIQLTVHVHEGNEWEQFGAWLEHSAFFVFRNGVVSPENPYPVIMVGDAFGRSHYRTQLPTEGTATWRGAMVGVDIDTADGYAGEANLVAKFGDGTSGDKSSMDVRFTDIANVETGAAREDIAFENVDLVGPSGNDGLGQPRLGPTRFVVWRPEEAAYAEAPIYIHGRLFGPDHEEAAGVFGYNGLIGAFGAGKQE